MLEQLKKRMEKCACNHSYGNSNDTEAAFMAGVIEVLEGAVECYGYKNGNYFVMHEGTKVSSTHKALFINIEPIKQESAEDVLREMVDRSGSWSVSSVMDWQDRAKKVLGKA